MKLLETIESRWPGSSVTYRDGIYSIIGCYGELKAESAHLYLAYRNALLIDELNKERNPYSHKIRFDK